MKRLLLALGLLIGALVASPALASNCPTFTYTLTNGQTADANQVMANFNTLLNCANNTLVATGANSSITSLSGLTTPLSVPQGGSGAGTFTAHGVMLGNGTGALSVTAAGTSGQVLTSNGSSADPTFQTVTTGVSSVFSRTGAVTANSGDYTIAQVTGGAPLASPTFTGTPAAPTATAGTSTTQIATTAYVATSYAPLASPAFTGSTPTSGGTALVLTNDSRFCCLTQNSQSTAYGLVLTDAGKQIYHPSADTTARTFTIPANSSVAFLTGTVVQFFNDCSAGIVTIAITTDTLELVGAGTTGSRTLAACGMATAVKVTSTKWAISGQGLT